MSSRLLHIVLLFGLAAPLPAQPVPGVSGVSIGITLGSYPAFAPVPGYPIYYAPQAAGNLFFYDGVYWAYSQDGWYSSAWYNGPWERTEVEAIPLFLLRIPVGYYRQPPRYFSEWRADEPPRWEERWGADWARRHRDWQHWDHRQTPAIAPLPRYQGGYSGSRYPDEFAQRELRFAHYPYQPQEDVARQVYQRPPHSAPLPPAAREDSRAREHRRLRDGAGDTLPREALPPPPERRRANRNGDGHPAPARSQRPNDLEPPHEERRATGTRPAGPGGQATMPQREQPRQLQQSRDERRGLAAHERRSPDRARLPPAPERRAPARPRGQDDEHEAPRPTPSGSPDQRGGPARR